MVDPTGIVSLVYTLFKDVMSYLKKEKKLREKENEYKHESKIVQLNDSECSRLVKRWEQEGYEVR